MCLDKTGDDENVMYASISVLTNTKTLHQIGEASLVYVTSLHVIHHAYITNSGHIISNDVNLYQGTCTEPPLNKLPSENDILSDEIITYERVFSLTGTACELYVAGSIEPSGTDAPVVFDLCSGAVSKPLFYLMQLAPYMAYLQSVNGSDIRVHMTHATSEEVNALQVIFSVLNIPNRIIYGGHIKAHTLYTPVPDTNAVPFCFNMFKVQLLSESLISAGLDYATSKTYPNGQKRDSILLLHTKGFTNIYKFYVMLQEVTGRYHLMVNVLYENNATLKDILVKFYSAVVIIGSHSPLMNYIVAGQPGLYVMESVDTLAQNCYQFLSVMLGHRYHGILSEQHNHHNLVPGEFENPLLYYLWKLKKMGTL